MTTMVVSGNTAMPHQPFVQSNFDGLSKRLGNEESRDTIKSTAAAEGQRLSATGSQSSSKSSFDGGDIRGPEVVTLGAIDRLDWSSGNGNQCITTSVSTSPRSDIGTAELTNRKLNFAECRSSSGESVDDDPDDVSADPHAITNTPLASPPPPLRHHLLFPPLGDDVIATETDSVDYSSSFDCRFNDVSRRETCGGAPDATTTDKSTDEIGSTGATRHLEQSRMTYREAVPDDDTNAIVRDSSLSTPPAAMSYSVDDAESCRGVRREADASPAGRRFRLSNGISRSLGSSLTESSSSYAPGDGARWTSAVIDAGRHRLTTDETLSTSSVERTSNRDEDFATFDDSTPITGGSTAPPVTHGDDIGWTTKRDDSRTSKTGLKRQSRHGLQVKSSVCASNSFVDVGSRKTAARKLTYESDRVVRVGPLGPLGVARSVSGRPLHEPARRQSRPTRRTDEVSSFPSSSSYLSDGGSSSASSMTSSRTSSISSSLDLGVRKPWGTTSVATLLRSTHTASGTRRRQGGPPTSATLKATDRDDFRRLPSVAHRDSSTDCQVWDEYQFYPLNGGSSNADDYEEEKLDAESFAQTDWSLQSRHQFDQVGEKYRSRWPATTTKMAVDGDIWRVTQQPLASGDQVRHRVDASTGIVFVGGPGEGNVYENGTEHLDCFDRPTTKTTRPGCHSSDDDNENYVADSYATTDSDAEDLEQLIDDSRQALRLATNALDAAKRLVAADLVDTVDRAGRKSGSVNDGIVDGSGFRQPYQPKLKEEMATCRTNIECLEPLIDALHHGTRNDVSRTLADVNRLTDLLTQWRDLMSDLSHIISFTSSQPSSTRSSEGGSDLHDWSSTHQRQSLQSLASSQAPTSEATPSSDRLHPPSLRQRHVDDPAGPDVNPCENVRIGDDRDMFGTTAATTLVDETTKNYQHRSQSFAAANFDHVINLPMFDCGHDDLESLRSTKKRRKSMTYRVCSCLTSPSNGTQWKVLFVALFLFAIVIYAWTECNSSTGSFNCHTYNGLTLNPRLRYVMGPPPT